MRSLPNFWSTARKSRKRGAPKRSMSWPSSWNKQKKPSETWSTTRKNLSMPFGRSNANGNNKKGRMLCLSSDWRKNYSSILKRANPRSKAKDRIAWNQQVTSHLKKKINSYVNLLPNWFPKTPSLYPEPDSFIILLLIFIPHLFLDRRWGLRNWFGSLISSKFISSVLISVTNLTRSYKV